VRERTAGNRRAPAGRSGTSLVEALVAAALVLILVIGVAGLLALALGAKRKGDVTAALAHAVAERLEALKSLVFDDPALAAGAYAATRSVEPNGCPVDEAWDITDEEDGLKRVRIRIRPAGSAGPETTAVAFILRDLGFGP
jgi:Tfp pilus assembly protein PilV